MLQAQTAPSGGQGQVAVGKGGGLWVGVRSLCASSCWLPPCARCTSQAARSPPLTPPSTLLPPRRAWVIGKKGELTEAACRPKAHSDRVTSLARAGTLLYSSEQAGGGVGWWWGGLGWGGGGGGGVGGSRVLTLVCKQGWGGAGGGGQGCTRLRPRQVGGPHPPVARSRSSAGAAGALAAHQCARCADALAPRPPSPPPSPPSQLVRRWQPSLLLPAAGPLYCHAHPVRTLAAGARGLLVSGDKGGEVAVWRV